MKGAKKRIVFTHGIDIDGYGCAILAKLAWGDDVDVCFVDNFDLDDKFVKIWGKTKFANYDEIFVTDHCLGLALCNMVDRDVNLRNKIKIFDHHASRLGQQDKYSWVSIIDERNGRKESGVSLFFEYLANQGFLSKQTDSANWVELTRLYDTWEWTKQHVKLADRLNTLAQALGREKYIENMLEFHNDLSRPFEFTEEEERIVSEYQKAFQEQVKKYASKIQIIDICGVKAGYVKIKDIYKNDIPTFVKTTPLAKSISFLLMPVEDREGVSLRSVDPDFDVSTVATKYGGGGHFGAASFPKANLKSIKEIHENLRNN